jgi:hypothetical protein
MLIYPDSPSPMTSNWWRELDPTQQYLKHYDNSLILKLFHTKGTVLEKIQAAKELTICERKMKFWERQEGFSQENATLGCSQLKKKWIE